MSHKLKNSHSRESSFSALGSADWPLDVLKTGYLRKLKKLKRKFFVLRRTCGDNPSKLEYFPTEKKWKSGCEPKKSIILKSCFNISKKLHPKHKNVICLYNHWECFSIVLDSEEELDEWLSSMLELYLNDIETDEATRSKPSYDHVWHVIVDDRELEFSKDLNGPYCLGLTSKSLSLIKTGTENFESLDFPLMSIRRCGHSGKHFFIELGRSAITGAGGVWMETEGTIVAQNMHETILSAMKSSRNKEEMGPHTRPRSASTSENSKPIATRRPVGVVLPQQLPPLSSTLATSRERCDTLPPRARTISENMQDSAYSTVSGIGAANGAAHYRESPRPHSLYAWPSTNSPVLSSVSYNPSSLSTSLYSNSSLMSFDEADGYQEANYSWYPQTSQTEGSLSAEPSSVERPNEYLMMSPTDDNMNVVHQKSDYLNMNPSNGQRPNSFEDKNNSESMGSSPRSFGAIDYMDMRSPSSSNPESYIPMSTIGSLNAEDSLGKKLSISSLSDHFSMEKLPTKDGYVPMAPGGAAEDFPVPMQDGYLSMSPLSTSLPKQSFDGIFFSDNSGSNSSMFGSNPAEFKLDKVPSLLKQSDDDSGDFIKPVRAYSIGSRSQIYECRTRAYSMGSERGKSDLKLSAESQIGRARDINVAAKSSSAPLLQNSVSKKTPFNPSEDSGYDFMEINYIKLSENSPADQKDCSDVSKKNLSRNWQRSSNRSSCATSPLLSLHEISEKPLSETESKTKANGSIRMSNPSDAIFDGSEKKSNSSTTAEAAAPTVPSDYVEMGRKDDHMVLNPSSGAKTKADIKPSKTESIEKHSVLSTTVCNSLSSEASSMQNPSSHATFTRYSNSPSHAFASSTKPSLSMGDCNTESAKRISLSTAAKNESVKSKVKPEGENSSAGKSSPTLNGYVDVTSFCGGTATAKEKAVRENVSSSKLATQVTAAIPIKGNQSSEKLDVQRTATGHGEYVNLMLGKQPPISPPMASKSGEQSRRNSESSTLAPPPPPPGSDRNYMNIKLGKPFTPLPNPALVASTAHMTVVNDAYRLKSSVSLSGATAATVASVTSRSSDSGSISQISTASSKSLTARARGLCFQSVPVMRKQMSAPAVPPSSQSEMVSPARKSSCPVTASSCMVRSPACASKSTSLSSAGAAGIVSLLRGPLGCSPDHSTPKEKTNVNSSGGAASKPNPGALVGEEEEEFEVQYENVSLPLSASSSSRPSSVSSEKELNYASLDLAPATSGEVPHSPCTLKLSHQQPINEEPLTYAEIDFTKSEGLRHTTGAVQEGRL